MAASATGYGPRARLLFDGDENKYELWEIKFFGYLRIQKLLDVVNSDQPDANKTQRFLQNWYNVLMTGVSH